MDGWVDGWIGGSKSPFKDCLQQSKRQVREGDPKNDQLRDPLPK